MTQTPSSIGKIERQLLPYLKMLGRLLILFALCAFVGAFFIEEEYERIAQESKESMPTLEFAPIEGKLVLRRDLFFLGSCFFLVIGMSCVAMAWKRGEKLARIKSHGKRSHR